MPSHRRTKHYLFALVALVLLCLWYTSSSRSSSSRQHAKYMETLVKLGEQDRLHQAVVDKLHSRLREAAEVAKERVATQMEERFRKDGGKEGGQQQQQVVLQEEKEKEKETKKEAEKEKEKETVKETAKEKDREQEKAKPKEKPKPAPAPIGKEKAPTPEDPNPTPDPNNPSKYDSSTELTSILRRSPIILFSKTYCPHSAAAKHILLELYTLTPPPYIVELDQHPHGKELQAFLKEKTGRGTVPNVLVNGRSLGGGDEVRGLHGEGKLEGVLRRMGGKRLGVEKVGGDGR